MLFNVTMKKSSFLKKILIFSVILLAFCCFFVLFSPISDVYTNEEEISVVEESEVSCEYIVSANSAALFSQPDLTSEKLATLSHKDEVLLEVSGGKIAVYSGTSGYNFYKLQKQYSNSEGTLVDAYILCDLVTPKTEIIVSIPNFNAQTNANCEVYLKESAEYVESGTTLEKGTRIFLYEGYDSSNEYTAISYVLDGNVLYGYLKTENISPDGLNPLIIVCLTIILALLGIIFAWLFIKRRKVKLKQQKAEKSEIKTTKN